MPSITDHKQLAHLIDPEASLDDQYAIIETLTEHMFDGEVLYQLARFFRGYEKSVNNPFTHTLDIVGTGGDNKHSLNYSTLSAMIAHAYGLKVAKFGNKAVTSQCGSFDFLHKLAVSIPDTPERAETQLKQMGRTFLFAPFYHPVFKYVIEVRKLFAQQGKKTIFNCLGPLLNPAYPQNALVGVYTPALLEPMAYALAKSGYQYAYVVHGAGFDELSLCGHNQMVMINGSKKQTKSFKPEYLGLNPANPGQLEAGTPEENFDTAYQIFAGFDHGAKAEMLILNAAAGIQVGQCFDKPLDHYVAVVQDLLKQGITLG